MVQCALPRHTTRRGHEAGGLKQHPPRAARVLTWALPSGVVEVRSMARLSKRQDDNWFIKFVPREWLEDNQLRRCGRYARGLWIDMIYVMHNETVRGTLPGDLQVLARLLPSFSIDSANSSNTSA